MTIKFIVTIGVTVKNNETTIKNTMDSILKQNFPFENLELIIVDGYSIDKTIDIIKKILSKSGMKHKFFYENIGLAYARQLIVNESLGKYIIWIDGDMLFSSDYVKKLVNYMEQNPKTGITKGQYGIYNKTNLVGLLEDIEFLLYHNTTGQINSKILSTSGAIYRVKAIKEINGFDINIKGAGEDTDAAYRIREKGWSTHLISAIFYEQRRTTWKALWDEYFWLGKGGYYLFKKNLKIYPLRKMFFPLLILDSIIRIPEAYRLTRGKEVFLLPLHYAYKRIAWLCGFITYARERNNYI